MTETSISKTYCGALMTHLFSRSDGNYNLCCHATPSTNPISVNDMLPFDYFFSERMESYRARMFDGEQLAECKSCYQAESEGRTSHRQWKYNKPHQQMFEVEEHSVVIKMRILGSYCNLSCYMCHPYNSSSRRTEMEQLDQVYSDAFNTNGFVNIKSKRFNEIVDHLILNAKWINTIHLTGGEPLLMPRHWKLVNSISNKHAKNINLVYDTNLTHLSTSDGHIKDVIEKFKQVSLGVSCDHFGDKLEWIRYGINANQFEQNLQKMKDNISSINVTVSLINIMDLDHIVEHYTNMGLRVNVTNVLRNPKMLSIRNLHLQDKRWLRKNLNCMNDQIRSELFRERSNDLLEQGRQYVKELDSTRHSVIRAFNVP